MSVPEFLVSSLVAATEEVFETMLATPLARLPLAEGPLTVPVNVVATVAFAGYRRGLVVVYTSMAAARTITGGMLGIPLADVNGEVPDAMGEVANMVAGTFRNRMLTREPPSDISVPTVTIGRDFSTLYSSSVERVRCPFDMRGEHVSVELILTGQPAAGPR
jgi:chemotaxis protein CheX